MEINDKSISAVNITDELLSAGICDNCKHPEMINTGGDGVNEPSYYELYCMKKKLFIEPQPVECQVKECDSYDLKS